MKQQHEETFKLVKTSFVALTIFFFSVLTILDFKLLTQKYCTSILCKTGNSCNLSRATRQPLRSLNPPLSCLLGSREKLNNMPGMPPRAMGLGPKIVFPYLTDSAFPKRIPNPNLSHVLSMGSCFPLNSIPGTSNPGSVKSDSTVK